MPRVKKTLLAFISFSLVFFPLIAAAKTPAKPALPAKKPTDAATAKKSAAKKISVPAKKKTPAKIPYKKGFQSWNALKKNVSPGFAKYRDDKEAEEEAREREHLKKLKEQSASIAEAASTTPADPAIETGS